MNKIISVFMLILLLASCSQNSKTSQEIIQKVTSLHTDKQKRLFLEEIYQKDQKIRKDLSSTEVKYGYDSREVKEKWFEAIRSDSLNLQKIELYLEKHGHPTISKHGELACRAPFIVIHHSSDPESREKYFDHLLKAYKNGDLDSGSFLFYLERFHSYKLGYRFTLPNPYREKQMIDSLVKRLGAY